MQIAAVLPLLMLVHAAIAHGLVDHRALINAAALISSLAPAMSIFGRSGTIYDAPPAFTQVFTAGAPDLNLPLGGGFQAAHIWVNNKSNQYLYLPDAPDVVGPGISRVVPIVTSDVARASWTVPAQYAVTQPNNPKGAAILIWVNAGVDIAPHPGLAETPTVSSPQVALGSIAVAASGNKSTTFNVPTGCHAIGILVQSGFLTALTVIGGATGGQYLSLPPTGVSASLQGVFVAPFFSGADSSVSVSVTAGINGASVAVVAIIDVEAQFVFNNITEQLAASLIGQSGIALGDTSVQTLAPDAGFETITTAGGPIGTVYQVLASFKAAIGSTIARVGALGALSVGTATSVTPAFGQVTAAGHLLLAVIGAQNQVASVSAGWVKAAEAFSANFVGLAVWYKPNCGAGEAAPTFTCAAGGDGVAMIAQLGEFSGAALANPVDQTFNQNSNASTTVNINNPAPDAAFGDLVVMVTRWALTSTATATFADSFNNKAAGVHMGDSGGVSRTRQTSFAYAIVPTSSSALPLGIAPWPYDVIGSSVPALGSKASVLLAAVPGMRYILHTVIAAIAQNSGAAAQIDLRVTDGLLGLIVTEVTGVTVTVGDKDKIELIGLALPGTANSTLLVEFSAGVAGIWERVNVGAYLRQ